MFVTDGDMVAGAATRLVAEKNAASNRTLVVALAISLMAGIAAARAALLHGQTIGLQNRHPICVHPMRTEFGRPNSSIRFRT